MTDARNLIQATSVMAVPDLAQAVAYFRDLLGFTVHVQGGDYAYLERDGCGMRLLDHTAVGATPPGTGRYAHYFDVRDVDAMHAEIAPRLADWPWVHADGPDDMAWGQRELRLLAPDGDRVVFGQAL